MRNVLIASIAALAGSMLFSTTAYAGGLGVISTGGVHTEHVYAYSEDLTQYKVSQLRPSTGIGLQAILGDFDDDFVGVAKIFWLGDFGPQNQGIQAAAKAQGAEGEVTYALREGIRPTGIAMAGLQWGVWGEPTGLEVNIITNLGAVFMTTDATEGLIAELGVGAHYALNDTVQVNAEVAYQARFRKTLAHSVGINLGARYFFD